MTSVFEVSDNGQVTAINQQGLDYFNQFVDELPEARLVSFEPGPHRVMLEADTREEALVELGILKASMLTSDNSNVMVMATKDYPFSAEAVQQLLELDADIERFKISQEPLQ